MTDQEVSAAYNRVWVDFWKEYSGNPPGEDTNRWDDYHSHLAALICEYPLMEEVIRRMDAEIMERARGRGCVPGDVHRPPGG